MACGVRSWTSRSALPSPGAESSGSLAEPFPAGRSTPGRHARRVAPQGSARLGAVGRKGPHDAVVRSPCPQAPKTRIVHMSTRESTDSCGARHESVAVRQIEPLPYTLLTRDAAGSGLSADSLPGLGYVRLRRGVWGPAGVEQADPDVRIAAVAAQLPTRSALGGWSAARLHEKAAAEDGLEVFDGGPEWEDASGPGPITAGRARVVVCSPRHSRPALRPDVRVFRSGVLPGDLERLAGIDTTSACRTAFDLARLLPASRGVVGVDRLMHLGLVAATDLRSMLESRRAWRGASVARRVAALTDGASESPQESLLRLLWLATGLPRPRCNVVLRDRAGRFVARVDLLDDVAGIVGEYDGAVHAEASRRSRDAQRQEALETLGLVVVRATSVDLVPGPRTRAWQRRLRDAYRRAASRPPGTRNWVASV